MLKMWKPSFFAMLVVISSTACSKAEEDETQEVQAGSKVYISNEGNFGLSNADVSYIDEDGVIHNDVFQTVNELPLGDVLQSLTIDGQRAYAVMNNSNSVVVFDATTFALEHVITDVDYPRHVFHVSSDKAYITTGSGSGQVYPLDKTNFTLGMPVAVGNGPEGMTLSDNQLYVCNSGGWGVDQTVSVIDTETDAVITTLVLSDVPIDAVTDANGDVWVLCRGQILYDESWNPIGHTDARLYHIDEVTNTVIDFIQVGSNGDHPASLAISKNKQTLYVANGDIYSMPITADAFSLWAAGIFNTVDVSQKTGEIWATGINDFINPGIVYHYSSTGVLKHQFTAGIGANGAVEP